MRQIPLLLLAGLALAAQPRITTVANSADFSSAVAPGSQGSIFGTGLAASVASVTAVPHPAALNGVAVSIGGRAARLSYVSPTQINFQVPYGVTLGGAAVVVTNGTATSNSIQIPVTATAPGVYQYGA
ncbi:MAG: IPT/TIG domain-containing protein, partial [Saprospiraceae bacterium]